MPRIIKDFNLFDKRLATYFGNFIKVFSFFWRSGDWGAGALERER